MGYNKLNCYIERTMPLHGRGRRMPGLLSLLHRGLSARHWARGRSFLGFFMLPTSSRWQPPPSYKSRHEWPTGLPGHGRSTLSFFDCAAQRYVAIRVLSPAWNNTFTLRPALCCILPKPKEGWSIHIPSSHATPWPYGFALVPACSEIINC